MKRSWVALSIVGFWLCVGLASAAEAPKHGGRLVFGLRRDIGSLNPFWRTQSTDAYVRELLFEALMDFDAQDRPVPALAESWKISPDGRVYTFKLRQGVKFHDGKEMTAADVKWSADYALDPQNAATGLSLMENVQSVEAKEKYTIEFTLKQPETVFFTNLASIRPFVVVPKDSLPRGQSRIGAFPAGTGPFMFKEYQADRRIVMTRNKNYWQKGIPYLDELELKPVRDTQSRFTSLRAGDLDLIERAPYAFVAKVLKGEFPELGASEAKYSGFRRLILEVTRPPFNNVKIRQAVRYALDRQEFVNAAFWGFGEPATLWGIPKPSPWYIAFPDTGRDPARVKQLLKEAGAGPDLEMVLLAGNGEEQEMQVLQRQLTSAGIKTKLEFQGSGTIQRKRRGGDFMITFSGAEAVKDPADSYPFRFGCEDAKGTDTRIFNYSGYCNREFDRLVEEAGRMQDHKKRFALYEKAFRIIYEEVPEIPLAFVPRYFLFNKKVRGFQTDSGGRFNLTTGGLSRAWLAQ